MLNLQNFYGKFNLKRHPYRFHTDFNKGSMNKLLNKSNIMNISSVIQENI